MSERALGILLCVCNVIVPFYNITLLRCHHYCSHSSLKYGIILFIVDFNLKSFESYIQLLHICILLLNDVMSYMN